MVTTIQISPELLTRLRNMKMSAKESYEDIIWDLVEDRLEFSKDTKENIEKSKREIRERKTVSFEHIKRKIEG